MKKEIIIGLTIIGLITIVAILAITTFTVSTDESTYIEEESTAPVSPIKSEGTLSVCELLENPVYDTDVKVYGKVSALGELLCPCFALTFDEKSIEVWYDMMEEDDQTKRPAVRYPLQI
jgi:hypothetical protein